MPISDAREHLADVVNRAVYGGEPTYITRRGRRLAVVASAAQLSADRARSQQQAILDTCRRLWQAAATADDATREHIRGMLDRIIEDAEHGSEPIPWEQVKADLGL